MVGWSRRIWVSVGCGESHSQRVYMWLGVDINEVKSFFQVGCIIACFIGSNDCVGYSWSFTHKKVNKWSVGVLLILFHAILSDLGGSKGGMHER